MGKTPENVAKVRDLILQDRRLTIQDLCNTLGLSYGTCQRILSEELNMRRIAAKFVPRLLQNEQKQHHLEMFRELQQQLQENPNFLSKVVTGDESWVIFLIGNKCDLDAQRDVTYEEAKQFADENGLMFVEASAKTGENVEEAFLETAKKIYQSIQDGRLDLNAAESGVQHKPSQPGRNTLVNDQQANRDSCAC
ncbi:hypothetical protein B7P43_G12312 [Cryptotermes secundus]|uniref:Ras-related protein Rab-14 n=1 Tax=Cryptotermes secundus TaxID=105785 RepID=A0A2J7RL25_9NEOP|nr:hypothetical protein B7P43_G12312 [Cryptotermes secundus]